ncbi:MAG: hypothetical protein KU37_07160 [Sulfuricurvum sp. PC08-66]|nr:MAG: hypothetical protein KU37_07160 [Sulfuricurvum sp. PC08-66]
MLKRFFLGLLIGVGVVCAQERVEPAMVTHMQQSHAIHTQLHAMEHVISIPYMTPLERDAKRLEIAHSMQQSVQEIIRDLETHPQARFMVHQEALKKANALLEKAIGLRDVVSTVQSADAVIHTCNACHAQFRK